MKTIYRSVVYTIAVYIYKMLEKIPRDDKIWIYGAWDGKMYSDNSKYMYLYMNNEHEEIKSIWITRSSDVVRQVHEDGYVAFRRSSIKGIYYCLRASVVFVTQGRGDVFGLITAGAKIIQLWHGMGIKDVSNVLPKEKCKSKQRYNELVHSHSNEFWMVSSQEAINKYSSAFGVPTKNMFITGQPKDDTFVNLCDNDFVKSIREANPGNKIVVYLPTHRGFGKDDKTKEMLSYENLAKVNEFLKSKNIIMIFKPHFHEFKNYKGKDTNMSNIIFATDPIRYGDVYQFLPSCDALITDYSGIMLGYLTANKPIIFFPYDLEDYISKDMGFCYKYEDVTPGPICYTWNTLVEKISEVLTCDKYNESRKLLREKFSPKCDGNNCLRVYQKVNEILYE